MPSKQKKSLRECSNMELAQLLMRDISRLYDADKHSHLSYRSRLLELCRGLCESVTYDWAPEYTLVREMCPEITFRKSLFQGFETIPLRDLAEYSDEEFICLCMEGIIFLHSRLENPSMIEQAFIELVCILLRSAERITPCVLGAYDIDTILNEGDRRLLAKSEVLNWLT